MAQFTVKITVNDSEYFELWSYMKAHNQILDASATVEQIVGGIAQRTFSAGLHEQIENMRLGLSTLDAVAKSKAEVLLDSNPNP